MNGSAPKGFSLVLCNNQFEEMFGTLWKYSNKVFCADGASSRIYDYFGKNSLEHPDYICGDLDSSRQEILDHYRDLGTHVEHIDDQNQHDLEKCIKHLQKKDPKCTNVIVYPVFGGRVDQEMAIYNTAFKYMDHFDQFMMLGKSNLAIVLRAGNNTIHIDSSWQGPTCGIIPLGSYCNSISTNGLKWNMYNQHSSMGGFVSTSNHILGDSFTIECSSPLLLSLQTSLPQSAL